MLSYEQEQLLQQSQTAFDAYYDALGASLVNFVERLGIQPAHEVLTNAAEYLPYIDAAMRGIVIAALNFSWQHARDMRADIDDSCPGMRVYLPHGTLFFASATHFQELFQPAADPARVTLDCRHLHMADHSAIAAIEALYERYEKAGKHLQVTQLSARNEALLQRAGVDVSVA